mgnify:CR=1 FL=1
MISIVHQGDHRYNIYRSGQDIGCIVVSANPYHDQHCYLNLGLTEFEPAIAKELFSLLRKELDRPLQVMCYSWEDHHDFLTAGGFERRRRCYELEVTADHLIAPLHASTELYTAVKGSPLYAACCELLYAYYCETHAPVSPLTVPPDVFCNHLPETVLCHLADSKPIHCAFIEPDEPECEIAYVATTELSSFCGFAKTLVHALFQKFATLTAECDDTDPAAMILKSMFRTSSDDSYDTYILK